MLACPAVGEKASEELITKDFSEIVTARQSQLFDKQTCLPFQRKVLMKMSDPAPVYELFRALLVRVEIVVSPEEL